MSRISFDRRERFSAGAKSFLACAARRRAWYLAALIVLFSGAIGCRRSTPPASPEQPTSKSAASTTGAANASAEKPDRQAEPAPPMPEPQAPEPASENATADSAASEPANSESTAESSASEIGAPPAAWPVFRGDATSNGVALSSLAEQPALLWKRSIHEGMFEATPAIADGVIYVGGLDGHFYALDLSNGEERWRYNSELGFRGAAAVRNELVYVGDSEGRFVCLDARTGDVRWGLATNAEINAGANFYQRQTAAGAVDTVLIGSQSGVLYALDAQSGDEQWRYSIDNMIQCSPTIADRRVFIAGCDNILHVIDVDTGEQAAAVNFRDATGVTPAAVGDRVYFATQGNRVLCVNWREEEIVWTYENSRRRNPYQSSPAVAGGVVVIGGRDRSVHGLNAETGEELWIFPTRAAIDGSPVIVGDRVYIGGGDGHVYGLNLASGEKLWEYEAGGDFVGSPAVGSERMVMANGNGDILCFGAKP